ncbi:MAG: response regulator transcription factor [Bacteroidetes bacterium]|nr:response regulator transcription factor [Bacteroidota bacterium]
MSKARILYAEDDKTLAFLTTDSLEQQQYEVTHCADGLSCLELFKAQAFDLCILDIMLPRLDGFELATAIRQINAEIPIVFLSAKTLKEDRIRGLKLGADDYLVKPFSMEELLLKVRVFLMRSRKYTEPEKMLYSIGRLQFNAANYTLQNSAKEITTLTRRESDLLRLFLDHKNQVLRREQILKAIWGSDDYFMGRSLDVFISRLRKVLSSEKHISIQNLHGIGFKLSDEG